MHNSMCGCGCGHGGGCTVSLITKTLLVIGGLNWGLVGIGMLMESNLNVVNMILGSMPSLEAIVYVLVGVAAIMKLVGCKCSKCRGACATCSVDEKMQGGMSGGM